MIEQQFLTTFNNITSYSKTSRFKDKKSNNIIDFINGMYQGSFSSSMEPEGVGAIIDDQFNFVVCSNWKQGKINGDCFIKLGSQIFVYGLWANNSPQSVACVTIGQYSMFIPYNSNNKLTRPKKCILHHKGKSKIYIVTIQKYPEGVHNKRQYSIIIQKIHSSKKNSVIDIANSVDIKIKNHELDLMEYLRYMSDDLGVLKVNNLHNGLFITAKLGGDDYQKIGGMCLGILLDSKKLTTRSVGVFVQKLLDDENTNKNYYQRQRFSTQIYQKQIVLNGLGLSKTMQQQKIIGVFKDDMVIRELNSQQKIQSIIINSKNYGRNLNGSVVKQLLGHEHMKSLSYQHNYIYFPQIKRIVTTVAEIHKYVQMFERLAPQSESETDQNDSIQYLAEKYQNNNYNQKDQKTQNKDNFHVQKQSSKDSIIDQYPEFRIDLKKDIYSNKKQPKKSNKFVNNNYITIQDQNLTTKKPGFILNRSPTPVSTTKVSRQKSKNRTPQKSPLKLNKKLARNSPKKQSKLSQWKN